MVYYLNKELDISYISIKSEIWDKLLNLLKDNPNEEKIILDFKGVVLESPWKSEKFIELMTDERVYLKLYTSKKAAETIELMLKLGNLKTNRVTNEDIIITTKNQEEENVNPYKRTLQVTITETLGVIVEKANEYEINIGLLYTQISEFETLETIQEIVHKLPICNVILNFDGVIIYERVIKKLLETKNNLIEEGYKIKLNILDEVIKSKIDIIEKMPETLEYNIEKKFEEIVKNIPINTVGILNYYKRSKKTDSFGREGKGEIVASRVAIFKEIIFEQDNSYVTMQIFDGNSFLTKEQNINESDEDIATLKSEEIKIRIEEIGFNDLFLGKNYHFNLPIQFNTNTSILVPNTDINDKKDYVLVRIPNHIKNVLDSYKVPYNQKMLDYAIKETDKILKEEK